jgi:MerR family redox-sensitive transcriptional activator SoxR
MGLLPEPEREGGKRRYDESVLSRLTVVKSAKRAGFTIGEIRTLFYGFPPEATASERWQRLASRKLEEVDEQVEQLRYMRGLLEEALQCNCASLDECAGLMSGA